MIEREKIVEQARSWIGTKFRYQGRIKKNKNNRGGVDCLGFIVGVADEIGFVYNNKPLSFYDNIVYSKKPDYELLKQKFSQYFHEKNIKNIEVGDIILQKLSKNQYHIMIFTGNSFIHSSATTFSVVEHTANNFDNCIIYSML